MFLCLQQAAQHLLLSRFRKWETQNSQELVQILITGFHLKMIEFSIFFFSYCSKLYSIFALSKSREWMRELSKVASCVIFRNQKELLNQQVLLLPEITSSLCLGLLKTSVMV